MAIRGRQIRALALAWGLVASAGLWAQNVVDETRIWQDGLELDESLLGERWYGFYFGPQNNGSLHFVVSLLPDGSGYLVEVDGSLQLGAREEVTETLHLDPQLRLLHAEQVKTSAGKRRKRSLTPIEGGLEWTETWDGQAEARRTKLEREPSGGMVHGLLLLEAHGGQTAGELAFVRLSQQEPMHVDIDFSGQAQRETVRGIEQELWLVELDEGERVTRAALRADGRVVRFGPDPRIGFLLAENAEQARADLSDAAEPAGDGPRATVADFVYGLYGDDTRFERCALWPQLTETRLSATAAAQGLEVTDAMRAGYRSEEMTARFREELRASARRVSQELAVQVLPLLTESVDGETAIVVEPGGISYRLVRVAGSWKIVDFARPVPRSTE